MPAYTPIREFINALKSGQTNMTLRLDYLYANRASIPAAVLDTIRTGSLHPTFPQDVKDLLKGVGAVTGPNKLSDDEIKHMEEWPAAEKAQVQGWIDTAITNGDEVKFMWELHREPGKPGTGDYAVRDPGSPVRITFRTYAQRVQLDGWPPSLGSISYK